MKAITKAFRQLRRDNVHARQNGRYKQMPSGQPWVYTYRSDGETAVGFYPPTAEFGTQICDALRAQGLTVKWDQNGAHAILIQD